MSFDQQQLNRLYQYAMTLSHQSADAYDLLQASLESYLKIDQSKNRIERPESYLRKLIRNRFIDQYRYDQRWDLSSFGEDVEFPAAIALSYKPLEELHIQRDQLERIWQKISPLDRDILYHWAVLGFSTQETSDLLDIPKGTLLSRVHRLRQKFKTAPEPHGDQHEY